MFAVYDKGSINFRSTVENLYDIKKVTKSEAIHKYAHEDVEQDYESHAKNQHQYQDSKDQAVNAYKKTANIDIRDTIYHAHQIMSKKCISIDIQDTLQDAYNLIKRNNINQIPITSSGNKIVSMLYKKNILNYLMDDLNNATNIMNKPIGQLSLPELITTDPISDIRRVAQVMLDFNIHAIPVVDESDILVGIVSQTDIIKAVSSIPQFQLWA